MMELFHGVFVALTTPYRDGRIDEKAFGDHVDWLVGHGVQGVVPCGTTGESIALSPQERQRLIQICVDVCHQRALIIPGVGMPTTGETIFLAKQAEGLGADGILVVTPYFVKADQKGLTDHYQKLHRETRLPLILYNNPNRTGVEIALETVKELSRLPRVIGLKDASPDLTRPLTLRQELGENFVLLSGEDPTMTAFLAQGGDGIVSVTACVAPHLVVGLYQAWKRGDLKTCFSLRDFLFVLNKVLFQATSPGPVKYAAHLLGFGAPDVRLPLSPLAAPHLESIAKVLEDLKVRDLSVRRPEEAQRSYV